MNVVSSHNMVQNIDLAEIVDLSADGIISLDEQQNIILFNAAAEKIFGYTSGEVIGQSLDILLPKSIHEKHQNYIDSFDRSERVARPMGEKKNLYGVSKSGEPVPLDITIQKHSGKGVFYYTAICRDIRHRIEKENLLRENEAKFRTLFDTSHQYAILTNGQGEILEFNKAVADFIVGDAKSYMGNRVWECDFWAKEIDSENIRKAIVDIEAGEGVSLVASLAGSPFGRKKQTRVLEIAIAVVPLESNQSTLIVIEGNDITNLLRTNKALTESQGRLTSAQKIARLGNWEWDVTTNEVTWSDEVYYILNLSPGDFDSSYEGFLALVHPDDRAYVEQSVIDALAGEKPYRIVHRMVLKDGSERIVEERAEIIRLEDGTPVRMNGIVQDITNRWRREQELILAKRKAEEANMAKAQFLSAVGHELRTPLNAIIGFSSMIAEEQLGKINIPTYRDYAEDIKASGRNLLGLIKNILDVTSHELESIKLHPQYFTARLLLENSLARMAEKAAARKINIETSLGSEIPELYLDPDHTQQMLVHLIDNAIKFSRENSTVKVNLDYMEDEFVIDVIDQGIGLEEADIEKVFDLFVQKDMDLNRRYGGIGLGLTMVKNLAELQGGRVQVKSIVGQGSCFSLYFSGEKMDAGYQH